MPQLRLVPNRDPCERREGESDDAYEAFLSWLVEPRPRRAPTHPRTAAEFDWSARAQEYDAMQDMPRKPEDLLRRAAQNLMNLLVLESGKHFRRAAKSAEDVTATSTLDLVRLAGIFGEDGLFRKMLAEQTSTNFDHLTDEEMEDIRRARRHLGRL